MNVSTKLTVKMEQIHRILPSGAKKLTIIMQGIEEPLLVIQEKMRVRPC